MVIWRHCGITRYRLKKSWSFVGRSITKRGKLQFRLFLALPNPPDAILAMNDTLAFAAIEVIKSHGLRVPNDIALIGYTDEQHANYIEPKLSAVSHQTYEMGETACLLLIDQIEAIGHSASYDFYAFTDKRKQHKE